MTTQEIIEGNKLIAAFMGLTKSINGLTSEVRYVYDWKSCDLLSNCIFIVVFDKLFW